MSTIYPRGKKGIYQYETVTGFKRSMGTNNETIAKQLQIKWDEKLLRSDNGLLDFDKTWTEFRAEYEKDFVGAESTLIRLKHTLDVFQEEVHPPEKLIGLKEEHCKRFRSALLSQGLLPQTVDTAEKYLRPFLSSAHRNGYIEKDPFANLKRLDFIVPEAKELTFHEVEKFQAAILRDQPHYRFLAEFLYDTGMRLQEAAHQRIEDVDFQMGILSIKIHLPKLCDCFQCKSDGKKGWWPKKKRQRIVPLTPRLLNQILALFQERQTGNIFQIRGRTIQNVCERAYEGAALQGKLGVHTWRHTLINELRQAGVDEQVRKKWVGHAKSSAHETYQHVAGSELTAAMNQLLAWRQEQSTKVRRIPAGAFEIIQPVEKTA